MRYSEAGLGRMFVLRLEDGDRLPEAVEEFCAGRDLPRALCFLIGGVRSGSRLVVGPEGEDEMPPRPVTIPLAGVHEILGIGTIFPDDEGKPSLHLHAACGRGGETATGCIRPGIQTWKVGEVVLLELTGSSARRAADAETGFSLLEP